MIDKDGVGQVVFDSVSSQLGILKEKLGHQMRLKTDLGADSLDCVELLMEFEDKLDLSISDEEAEKFEDESLEKIIDALDDKIRDTNEEEDRKIQELHEKSQES